VVKTIDLLGTGVQNTLEGVQVLANPVTHVINISNLIAEPVQFYLFNHVGQLIRASQETGSFSVNVSDLASGVYVAEISVAGKGYRTKVVKQ
jgi:hypothetical protein